VIDAGAIDLLRPKGSVRLLGMGSSRYAASVAARYLQHAGIPAVTDCASAEVGPEPDHALSVLAVSAGGGSGETVESVDRPRGTSHLIALTNQMNTQLTRRCDVVLDVLAGIEIGGVACRSYSHARGSVAPDIALGWLRS
jgi:glucosamine--fructose-6-phosphate aminotransferase (isomerizing)